MTSEKLSKMFLYVCVGMCMSVYVCVCIHTCADIWHILKHNIVTIFGLLQHSLSSSDHQQMLRLGVVCM